MVTANPWISFAEVGEHFAGDGREHHARRVRGARVSPDRMIPATIRGG